jgi:hypothetical protein
MASYFKEEHMTGIERIAAERKRQIEEEGLRRNMMMDNIKIN